MVYFLREGEYNWNCCESIQGKVARQAIRYLCCFITLKLWPSFHSNLICFTGLCPDRCCVPRVVSFRYNRICVKCLISIYFGCFKINTLFYLNVEVVTILVFWCLWNLKDTLPNVYDVLFLMSINFKINKGLPYIVLFIFSLFSFNVACLVTSVDRYLLNLNLHRS